MNKIFSVSLFVFLGVILSLGVLYMFGPNPNLLGSLQRLGINRAKAEGDYRCCIEPDCTMCYMEGNKWNNGEAGTCACDDLIAKGEKPCPQCEKALGSTCGAEL